MNLPTVPTFWERLQQSRLLSGESWRAAREQLGDSDDVRQVCQQLVIRHYLTRWQCKELLLDRKQFHLAKYRLLDQLGQGGMGMVFKAEHVTTLRVVALKVVAKRGLETPNGLARFRREVQVIAALNHPHIITAVDADCDDEHGQHFLVMEYVEGHDLNYWLQHEHPLPIDWACECIRQAAVGLQHACDMGMVHRDIKPSNLLVVAEDVHSPPIVKILDMGMARYSELDEDDEITATGQILGTPDYIAPEQAEDTTGADIRSDIFSLGCTLFKVLTGKVPFQGRNSMEKLMARAKRDAPPVSAYRDEVPPAVERVVAKMLARNLEERYQTPMEVAEALHPFSEFAPRPRLSTPRKRPTVDTNHPQAQFLAFLDTIDRDAQAEKEKESAREQASAAGFFRKTFLTPEGPTSSPASRSGEAAAHRKTYVAPEPPGTRPSEAAAYRKTYVPPESASNTPPADRGEAAAHRKTFVPPEGPLGPPPVRGEGSEFRAASSTRGQTARPGDPFPVEAAAPLPTNSPLASDGDSFDSIVGGDPSQTPIVGSPRDRGSDAAPSRKASAPRPASAGPAGRGPAPGDAGENPVLEEVFQPRPYAVEGDSHVLTSMPSGLEVPRLEGDQSGVGADQSSVAQAKAQYALDAAVALLDPRPIDPEASTQVKQNALVPTSGRADSSGDGPSHGVAGVKGAGGANGDRGRSGNGTAERPSSRTARPSTTSRPAARSASAGVRAAPPTAVDRPPPKPPTSDGSSIRKFLWADRSSMKSQYRPKPKFPWTAVLVAGSVLPLLLIGYLVLFSGGGRNPDKGAGGNGGERRPASGSNVQFFEWTGIPVGSRHLLHFTPKTAGEYHLQLEVLDSEPGLVVTTYVNDRVAAAGRYIDEAFLKAKQPIHLGDHVLTTVEQVLRVEAELPSLRANWVDYGVWYGAGPFHPAAEAKKNALDSYLEAEGRFDLGDSFRGAKGHVVKWTKAVLTEADENDLEKVWGKDSDQLPAFGLLCRTLTAQKAGSVRMFFGSQAPMLISLNDKPVYIQPHGLRNLEPYDKLVRLELKEGKNLLRVKFLVQKDQAKFFFADRTPPHSTWDTPLKFALTLHPIGPSSEDDK